MQDDEVCKSYHLMTNFFFFIRVQECYETEAMGTQVGWFVWFFVLVQERFNSVLQGVTKTCHLSLLTNSALVYESKCGGLGGLRGLSQ
jgi:hypothetical protein